MNHQEPIIMPIHQGVIIRIILDNRGNNKTINPYIVFTTFRYFSKCFCVKFFNIPMNLGRRYN